MSSDLSDLILSLTPEDGSSIGNGAMMALLKDHLPQLSEDDYAEARDALVDDGVLGRGKGRGGSVYRADVAELELSVTPEPVAKPAAKTTRKKGAARSDEPTQVVSYRHGETRVNNPEVGMVHADTDPDGEKSKWAYDAHLDPVLNFDSARGAIETLIDDALASDDPVKMKDALTELKRLQQPYLNWTGKAEKTSFEVDTVKEVEKPDLLAATLAQLADAIEDVLENPSNGLNANSLEIRKLRRTIERYANDPQRVEMDLTTVHHSLAVQIGSGELPPSDENNALLLALQEGAQGIRATDTEVAENRKILQEQSLRELSPQSLQQLADAAPILESLTEGDLQEQMREDVLFLTQEMRAGPPRLPARLMRAQGSGLICLTSSTAGQMGYPLRSPYASAKWAIVGLTKTLAMELGEAGVRVNAICPGAVEGPRMDRVIENEASARGQAIDAVRQSYVKGVSMKTWVTAQDVANTIRFLASPSASRTPKARRRA